MSNLYIVGGGLAGMTVAWQVTRPDRNGKTPFGKVHLYERSDRLGGKAGSNLEPKRRQAEAPATESEAEPKTAWSDHGYHLFPRWYRNVIELMGEIGVDYDNVIVDGERFSQAARLPKFGGETEHDGARRVEIEYQSVKQLFWVAITTADLISRPDEELENLTMKEFINERFPMLENQVKDVYEGLLLKALAADIGQMSALAVAKLFRRWSSPLRSLTEPSWSSLRGSLQQQFIIPFEQALDAADVDVVKSTDVDFVQFDGVKASALKLRNGRLIQFGADDQLVLAVPPNVLQSLLREAPHGVDVDGPLATLAKMTTQFSGIDIYFGQEQVTPREHFGFKGSALTAYNITPVWEADELVDDEAPTVVQLVMPGPGTVSKKGIKAAALAELGEAFAFSADDEWLINVNDDSKLSLANVGVYEARRQLSRALRPTNIRVSGDFMPSSIGVPSMEGAVGNGRRVAAELRGRDPASADQDVSESKLIKSIATISRCLIRPIQAIWSRRNS